VSSAAPAQPSLVNDLWTVAQTIAGARGFQFSPESGAYVQSLIRDGVTRLVEDGALGDAAKAGEAKSAIGRLVNKMIELAIEEQRGQKIKGTEATSANMLHEYTFLAARPWFCPCYPFC
jgi:hypothetical protein